MEFSYYRWKSFSEDEDRPEKPRQFGVTEIRGPDHCLVGSQAFEVKIPSFLKLFSDRLIVFHLHLCR